MARKKKPEPVVVKDKSFFVCRFCGHRVIYEGGWAATNDEGLIDPSFLKWPESGHPYTCEIASVHSGKEVTEYDLITSFVDILKELAQ